MVNKKADRARQFLPFDALKGYRQAILNKEKIIVNKKELSEDDALNLSYKLSLVKCKEVITVIYYDGENYVSLQGMVSKVCLEERYIKIVKTKICIDDIINISGENIKDI